MASIYQYQYQIALGRVEMAKPSVFRAEQLMPLDLSTDRSIYRGGHSSTSPRRDIVFVVNPRGLSLSRSLSIFVILFGCLNLKSELELEQVQMEGRLRNGRNYFPI